MEFATYYNFFHTYLRGMLLVGDSNLLITNTLYYRRLGELIQYQFAFSHPSCVFRLPLRFLRYYSKKAKELGCKNKLVEDYNNYCLTCFLELTVVYGLDENGNLLSKIIRQTRQPGLFKTSLTNSQSAAIVTQARN